MAAAAEGEAGQRCPAAWRPSRNFGACPPARLPAPSSAPEQRDQHPRLPEQLERARSAVPRPSRPSSEDVRLRMGEFPGVSKGQSRQTAKTFFTCRFKTKEGKNNKKSATEKLSFFMTFPDTPDKSL